MRTVQVWQRSREVRFIVALVEWLAYNSRFKVGRKGEGWCTNTIARRLLPARGVGGMAWGEAGSGIIPTPR